MITCKHQLLFKDCIDIRRADMFAKCQPNALES